MIELLKTKKKDDDEDDEDDDEKPPGGSLRSLNLKNPNLGKRDNPNLLYF